MVVVGAAVVVGAVVVVVRGLEGHGVESVVDMEAVDLPYALGSVDERHQFLTLKRKRKQKKQENRNTEKMKILSQPKLFLLCEEQDNDEYDDMYDDDDDDDDDADHEDDDEYKQSTPILLTRMKK